MLPVFKLFSVLIFSFASATSQSSFNSIDELVNHVYANYEDTPKFIPLPHATNIAIADNDTASLKVMDLFISHYPIKKGRITFDLINLLTKDIPGDSIMKLTAFADNEQLFDGTLPVCEYLVFADLYCPIKAYKAEQSFKKVLQVPDEAKEGRLSFVSKVTTPKGELISHIAGIIDLINDGTTAEEIDELIKHDEL